MKRKMFCAIVLGILLCGRGFDLQGQQRTAPPPPPDRESSIIPDPGEEPEEQQAPAQRQTPARRQTPVREQAPTRNQTPARGQTPARSQEPAESPETEQTPTAGLPDRGFFLGGRIGGGPLSADVGETYSNYDYVKVHGEGMFGAGLFAGYDFGLFTGQLGFLFASDAANIERDGSEWVPDYFNDYGYKVSAHTATNNAHSQYEGTLLQIPLIAKVDLHLGRFVFQPLAGLYLNFGLGTVDYEYSYDRDSYYGGLGHYSQRSGSTEWKNPLLGWVAGGTLGFQLGPGFVFFEARYMANFGFTEVPIHGDFYRRSATLFGGGYQYYFR